MKMISRNRLLVYQLKKEGELRGVKIHNHWYFFEDSVKEYLNRRTEKELAERARKYGRQ